MHLHVRILLKVSCYAIVNNIHTTGVTDDAFAQQRALLRQELQDIHDRGEAKDWLFRLDVT